jgi:signal transduction histidine kinase
MPERHPVERVLPGRVRPCQLQGVTPQIARPQVEERVSSVVDDLDATIKDIRTAIFALQAREGKERHGLRARVMEVLEQMTGPLELSSSVRLDDQLDGEVPGDIGEDMLHALREALSNAARHSKATQIEVTVAAGGDLRLLVRDNGTGMGGNDRRSGLANLVRRAVHYGGTLTVGPAADGGTELDWRVPLSPSRP